MRKSPNSEETTGPLGNGTRNNGSGNRDWRGFTDIRPAHWTLRIFPNFARPYLRLARLDRPIGTWLLLWPCWWAIALASETWPSPQYLALFAIGALVMRGAGCVWNDIVDRDIDGQVERTAVRPIPAGEVSLQQAAIFMAGLGIVGLVILLNFNFFAIMIGLASLAPVVIYPFMKRITWWPQFFLGLAFNWGALLGWAAIQGELPIAALFLYFGGIAWTLGYDTIYALQDLEDDALVGVRSSARRLGANTRPWLAVFFAIALLLFSAAAMTSNLNPIFWIAIVIAGVQLIWQFATLNPLDQTDCLVKFNSNTWFGWILFAGFIAGRVLN